MAPSLRPFTAVRVTAIRADRLSEKQAFCARLPKLGDVGAIVESHELPEPAYEVECCDPATGVTLWLEAMYPDEVEEILPHQPSLGCHLALPAGIPSR
jgi:hypothetical protein